MSIRKRHEKGTPVNPSNWTLRWPRTRCEAGLPNAPIHEPREPAWYGYVGYTCLGVILTYLFFVAVLSLKL